MTLMACYGMPPQPQPRGELPLACATDEDGDGHCLQQDCDDLNPAVHPAATDVPGNGIDENCDGVDGEPGATSRFAEPPGAQVGQ